MLWNVFLFSLVPLVQLRARRTQRINIDTPIDRSSHSHFLRADRTTYRRLPHIYSSIKLLFEWLLICGTGEREMGRSMTMTGDGALTRIKLINFHCQIYSRIRVISQHRLLVWPNIVRFSNIFFSSFGISVSMADCRLITKVFNEFSGHRVSLVCDETTGLLLRPSAERITICCFRTLERAANGDKDK